MLSSGREETLFASHVFDKFRSRLGPPSLKVDLGNCRWDPSFGYLDSPRRFPPGILSDPLPQKDRREKMDSDKVDL